VLLVVCPNLGIDRVLQVENFQASKVQRSRSVLTQPGGKGSNVARVFRQLGGDVVLVGFVGEANSHLIRRPLERCGVHVDVIGGYPGDSRTCTIVCDTTSRTHPTVINEETPLIEPDACSKLWTKVQRWIPKVDGVLATGSLSTGLPEDFYARILDHARLLGKLTAIDATGAALRCALMAGPAFTKPNRDEFFQLINGSSPPSVVTLAPHTALTFGRAGAVLVHRGQCLYAGPPQLFDANPIGAGDAFCAAYLKYLLHRRPAADCLQFAMAAAASDASTLRPGFVNISQIRSLTRRVALRFL